MTLFTFISKVQLQNQLIFLFKVIDVQGTYGVSAKDSLREKQDFWQAFGGTQGGQGTPREDVQGHRGREFDRPGSQHTHFQRQAGSSGLPASFVPPRYVPFATSKGIFNGRMSVVFSYFFGSLYYLGLRSDFSDEGRLLFWVKNKNVIFLYI